jgi:predicted regulator of amino acid metabolism with ACT domain
MLASEAKKLSLIYKEVMSISKLIEIAAKRGETSIKVYIANHDAKSTLKDMGYHTDDDIDCDSDYRGTWISW